MAAICALAAPWWKIPGDQADSAGMLAHLHALFVDFDLLYDNEYASVGMSPLFAFVTPQGVVSNHWPAGATWLQAPGYLLGIAAAKILAALGIGRGSAMGIIVVLAVRAWAVMVLVGMASAIARFVQRQQAQPDSPQARRAGWITAVLAVVATPLLYYATESPLRPHLWGAALCLGFIIVWSRPRADQGDDASGLVVFSRTLVLASLAGMATYVRPQLAPLWLLVAHDVWSAPRRGAQLLVSAAVFGLWPLAYVRTQWWMYGEAITDAAGTVTHHTSYFLLSTHHGVLPWCPVLALIAVALVYAVVRKQRGAWLIVGLVVMQIWLDGGMRAIEPGSVLGTRTWAGGVSFGPRKLVDILPLALPAVALAIAEIRARGHGRWLLLVVALLCLPTVALHLSAWIDPNATTGGIMGTTEYVAALRRPFDGAAWAHAWEQRQLPLLVSAVVGLMVVVPLWGVGVAVVAIARRGSARSRSQAAVLVVVLGLALVHGMTAVALVRSDAIRREQPQRMLTAAARMLPAHVATVRQIPRHHAALRARLGQGAAPAP